MAADLLSVGWLRHFCNPIEECEMKRLWMPIVAILLAGCTTNEWKIPGGPAECMKMCQEWDLEFAGMVGVGDQSKTGQAGATACVCQVSGKTSSLAIESGATAAALASPIKKAQEAEEARRTGQQ